MPHFSFPKISPFLLTLLHTVNVVVTSLSQSHYSVKFPLYPNSYEYSFTKIAGNAVSVPDMSVLMYDGSFLERPPAARPHSIALFLFTLSEFAVFYFRVC